MAVELLIGRAGTEPYVEQIQKAADTERGALGFLPASAYAEFSYQNRLIAAVDESTRSLAGYVLFGGAMPQGRIFQTWVDPIFRGQGIGYQLVEQVALRLEGASYLSIRADVAQDLVRANTFYESLGFEKLKTRAGGKTRKRQINVRVRELATPSLLDWADSSHAASALSLGSRANSRSPLYVLDLNVLFDVTKRRLRAEDARRVMSAAFENDFRLAVAAELLVELRRNTIANTPDPTLEFALTLPRLAQPPRDWINLFSPEVALQVFSDRAREGRLTKQDNSDLVHLMTAIHECAAGFVTSEKAILKAADYFKKRHGLEVVSPEALAPQGDTFSAPNVTTDVGGRQVSRVFLDGDHEAVSSFVLANQGSMSEVRALLSAGTKSLPRRRFVILADGEIRAVAAWDAPTMSSAPRELQIYVTETDPFAAQHADHLVARAVADVGSYYPAIFEMSPPARQSTLRRVAVTNGFFPVGGASPRTQKLRKIALGVPLGQANWVSDRARIESRSGIVLPATPPKFSAANQTIGLSDRGGKVSSPTLTELENFLSPILVALPNRPSVILPITQAYAEDLFRGSAQPTLLADRQAIWHPVRFYICKAGSCSLIDEGGLAVFYESGTGGGRSAAIAAARISRRYLMLKETASIYAARKGVLDAETIRGIGLGTQVTVVEFDNLMLFRHPVSLSQLRGIGCADGANFVTAKRLSSHHLQEIFFAGDPHA